MSKHTCGNCRFFKPDQISPYNGLCDFVLPDFLKKYDDDITQRRMNAENDYCSFWRKRKIK